MNIVPCVTITALSLALVAPLAAQRARGVVQLEAGDCSTMQSQFGNQQMALRQEHASLPVSSATVTVDPGSNGGVRIEHLPGSSYSITACIYAGGDTAAEAERAAQRITVSTDGNRIRVNRDADVRHANVHLIIGAPAGAQLDVSTTNGPISVHGFEGKLTARASNGPIALKDASGQVQASAVNGPITIAGNRGRLDAETQNGPISVDLDGAQWDGQLTARSSNGPLSIRLRDDYQSGVEISSSGSSSWRCGGDACGSDRDFGRGARTVRLGIDPVVVRVSTSNGPVTIDRPR